jgi:hypothetical protein
MKLVQRAEQRQLRGQLGEQLGQPGVGGHVVGPRRVVLEFTTSSRIPDGPLKTASKLR